MKIIIFKKLKKREREKSRISKSSIYFKKKFQNFKNYEINICDVFITVSSVINSYYECNIVSIHLKNFLLFGDLFRKNFILYY